mgnify:CR=1 FL=1
MINPKQIFTWWHKQTIGTFLKTMFYGKFVGEDSTGNKYYISKKNERWVIYQDNIEASKISADWYLWMHHTVNEIPNSKITTETSGGRMVNGLGEVQNKVGISLTDKNFNILSILLL